MILSDQFNGWQTTHERCVGNTAALDEWSDQWRMFLFHQIWFCTQNCNMTTHHPCSNTAFEHMPLTGADAQWRLNGHKNLSLRTKIEQSPINWTKPKILNAPQTKPSTEGKKCQQHLHQNWIWCHHLVSLQKTIKTDNDRRSWTRTWPCGRQFLPTWLKLHAPCWSPWQTNSNANTMKKPKHWSKQMTIQAICSAEEELSASVSHFAWQHLSMQPCQCNQNVVSQPIQCPNSPQLLINRQQFCLDSKHTILCTDWLINCARTDQPNTSDEHRHSQLALWGQQNRNGHMFWSQNNIFENNPNDHSESVILFLSGIELWWSCIFAFWCSSPPTQLKFLILTRLSRGVLIFY